MQAFRNRFHWLRAVLAAIFLITSLAVPMAGASMVGTDSLVQEQSAEDARERVQAMLDRDDVRGQLIALGVDPADAESRVSALTEAEAQQLAAEMDKLPAGGSVVGAIVLVFLVLLLTDILGFTNVFPFVTNTAR